MTRSYLDLASGASEPRVEFAGATTHDADTWQVLEQANGILMGVFGLDPISARTLLKRWSTEVELSPYALALILTLRASANLAPLRPPPELLGDRR